MSDSVALREEPIANVGQLAGVAMMFTVDRVFDVATYGEKFGDFTLKERQLTRPYIKDYDALPNEGPANWAKQFDLSRWFFISAWNDARRIGGAVVACQTKGVNMLEDRDDLAVLWDIRVAPEFRGKAVGAALFCEVEANAKRRGCRELKVETQNINVPACRFYARQGCQLDQIISGAYPNLPDEVQMIWRKPLLG
ncbi:MAG: GNAT family N-acetyltransferase [Opitutaceae bacterium]|nr:GNAT family N-acetyltransferase [Opitutaceae bacterium]